MLAIVIAPRVMPRPSASPAAYVDATADLTPRPPVVGTTELPLVVAP